jgi:hypothetical protein
MKIQALRDFAVTPIGSTRVVYVRAGEFVEVIDVDGRSLIARGSAVEIEEQTPAETKPKKTVKVI